MPDLFGLFLLGVVYGATTCSITCLPYLSPYLLATGKGFRDGIGSSAAYLSGKVLTYAVLGALAAAMGHMLFSGDNAAIRLIQGITLIVTGLALPFIAREGCRKKEQMPGRNASLFALGMSSSLVPCFPVLNMLTAAAKSGSVVQGSASGLFYGAGIALSPLLILGGVFAVIAKTVHAEARSFTPYLRGLAMIAMVIMGIKFLISG